MCLMGVRLAVTVPVNANAEGPDVAKTKTTIARIHTLVRTESLLPRAANAKPHDPCWGCDRDPCREPTCGGNRNISHAGGCPCQSAPTASTAGRRGSLTAKE